VRGTQLAPVMILRELSRLLDVYSRPKHWPPDDETVARNWADIMGDVSSEQLAQGVTLYLREDHQFMPRPGTLRVLSLKQPGVNNNGDIEPGSYEAWVARGYQDPKTGRFQPCPACNRAWQAHPRITIVHDHSRHRALQIPCSFSCDSIRCLGTYGTQPLIPPVALSDGEVWIPPTTWKDTLGERAKAREALTP